MIEAGSLTVTVASLPVAGRPRFFPGGVGMVHANPPRSSASLELMAFVRDGHANFAMQAGQGVSDLLLEVSGRPIVRALHCDLQALRPSLPYTTNIQGYLRWPT
jgi:hypothetical protein